MSLSDIYPTDNNKNKKDSGFNEHQTFVLYTYIYQKIISKLIVNYDIFFIDGKT